MREAPEARLATRLLSDSGIKRRNVRGESFGVVVFGRRNGNVQRVLHHVSQGAEGVSRRRSRSVGAGGAAPFSPLLDRETGSQSLAPSR